MTITQAAQPVLVSTALAHAAPETMGIDPQALERLYARIEWHIHQGWYPGAAIAMARHGKLVASRAFGSARIAADGTAAQAAGADTLWLLFSQTKPIVSAAIWHLIERGQLRFHDAVAEYLPDFARNGKAKVTIFQLLSHQGGFPGATVPPAAWSDHALLRETVCNFTLEWEPGAHVIYHASAAHWVQAVLIEAVTGQDYRQYVRRAILDPLNLPSIQIGVPDALHGRLAHMYKRNEKGEHDLSAGHNEPDFWRAGTPGGGGYASPADLTAFYQMLLAGGALNGARILSPRMVQYATRNHTGERPDESASMGLPMHRGMGVHVRGETAMIRGLGSIAGSKVFGHGGAGSSYSWADPETGVTFTYLSNSQLPEPLHSKRLDEIAVMAHAAVVEL
jgi:CubicO group peptidase (beta-lactamase class C family)